MTILNIDLNQFADLAETAEISKETFLRRFKSRYDITKARFKSIAAALSLAQFRTVRKDSTGEIIVV